MKPILFNTDMVRAILDSRKTVMRRAVRPQPIISADRMWRWKDCQWRDGGLGFPDSGIADYAPYQPGDILYVRETWAPLYPDLHSNNVVGYIYKADPLSVENYDKRFPDGKDYQWEGRWRPSIHMPREAARIFLRVTDVRVERLQDITEKQAVSEGYEVYGPEDDTGYWEPVALGFLEDWDSTINPKDRALYGWEANPWVWVIEFERCEKPKEG